MLVLGHHVAASRSLGAVEGERPLLLLTQDIIDNEIICICNVYAL